MTLYKQYYNKAIELIKSNESLSLQNVTGVEYPSNKRYKIACDAISDVKAKEKELCIKYHPIWYKAIIEEKDITEQHSLELFHQDGGMNYLQYLIPIK